MSERRHGGDVYRNDVDLDFSVNVNPLGLPAGVKKALRAGVDLWDRYPDPECEKLCAALAGYHRVPQTAVFCANGAAELIYRLVRALKPRRALLLAPSFLEYELAMQEEACEIRYFYLEEKDGFVPDMNRLEAELADGADILFFCNPNNPTGIPVKKEQVERLAEACHRHHVFLALDECFCEFLDRPEEYSLLDRAGEDPGLMVIRAFTKTYAMAGLRLGYAVCGGRELLSAMGRAGQPWNVSLPAQEAGIAALEEKSYLERSRSLVASQREAMQEELRELGFTVYDSKANFIFFGGGPEAAHGRLWEECRKRRILIRDCSNFRGLEPGYYRVCVRGPRENRILMETLRQIVS